MDESSSRGIFESLEAAQRLLDQGFKDLPLYSSPSLDAAGSAILNRAAERLHDNFPYDHPLYAGQMLKPPHPIARAAYALAMAINPNNHALDGGRASSGMEIEAVAELAKIFGWNRHLGHLTSGGTFANLEALWIAGRFAPGKRIMASDQAHYTHGRISEVLGLAFDPVATDASGRMDLVVLERELNKGDVGTVVATLGTTAIGAIDPLDRILALHQRYNFRLHVDAAYGGYFALAGNLDTEARAAFDVLTHADSIVIDPHKHGLQPYGCGAVLFRDPEVGRFYKHDSPYTYFSSKELHLGEISLECSRAGAAAVALWATQQLLPYKVGGEFAKGLEQGRAAALELRSRLAAEDRFVVPITSPQLDIVFWAVRSDSVQMASALAHQIFEESARSGLHLALATLPARFFKPGTWVDGQSGNVVCLRSVLMKPQHLEWIDEIWNRLKQAAGKVTERNRAQFE